MRFLLVLMLFVSSTAWAQIDNASRIQLTQSTDPNAGFRLYPTQNFYTFLELNTSTGAISVVQWALEDDKRFKKNWVNLPSPPTPEKNRKGRFTLYPTTNIYNFVLLDTDTGTTWQYQWAGKDGGTYRPIKLEVELLIDSLTATPDAK